MEAKTKRGTIYTKSSGWALNSLLTSHLLGAPPNATTFYDVAPKISEGRTLVTEMPFHPRHITKLRKIHTYKRALIHGNLVI